MKVAKASLVVAAAAALIGIPFLLRDRQDTFDKPAGSRPPAKPSAAVGFAPVSSKKSKAASSEAGAVKRDRPEPVSEDVRLKVDALVRRLKDMSGEEQMRDPEFNALMQRFTELLDLNSNDESSRLSKAMMGLMGTKGIDIANPDRKPQQPPGVATPFGRFDGPVGRSWLEAVVSDDPERVEDWIVNRFDGASFEFALDPGLERTSEGVSLIPPADSKKPEE